jgi:hypothetical protein
MPTSTTFDRSRKADATTWRTCRRCARRATGGRPQTNRGGEACFDPARKWAHLQRQELARPEQRKARRRRDRYGPNRPRPFMREHEAPRIPDTHRRSRPSYAMGRDRKSSRPPPTLELRPVDHPRLSDRLRHGTLPKDSSSSRRDERNSRSFDGASASGAAASHGRGASPEDRRNGLNRSDETTQAPRGGVGRETAILSKTPSPLRSSFCRVFESCQIVMLSRSR